ncbi:MAG TPA: hypothetical protein VGF38_16475 [Ktedonobacterales bacterium]|jgi:hypothetical protein
MSRLDSQSPPGYSDDDDHARGQRIAAMRELTGADTSAALPPISPAITPPVRRNRRVPLLLIALTAVVLLAVVGAAWQGWFPWQRGKPATTDTTVSVNLADDNLHCPSAAVWSPDNKHIAVLAQLGACTIDVAGVIEPTVVALFDTQGKLERLFYPDSVALGKSAPTSPLPTPAAAAPLTTVATNAQYFAMSWSPDGGRLALVYQITFQHDQDSYGKVESGVILLPTDGGAGEKLAGFNQSQFDLWDLQAHKQIHVDNTAQVFALAYEWTAEGALTPVDDAPTSGPIGDPARGQRFTIWQPGSVNLDRTKQSLDFGASYMVWSPDGRYLVPYFGSGGELAQGASGLAPLNDGSYQLPYRDKALLVAASQLKSPSNPNASMMPVSWRGDGRLLAAMAPNPLIDLILKNGDGTVIPDATEHIVIYDCATGAKRLTLATKRLANRLQTASIVPTPVLRWSSTGQQLVLLDTSFDSLTIWDVALK